MSSIKHFFIILFGFMVSISTVQADTTILIKLQPDANVSEVNKIKVLLEKQYSIKLKKIKEKASTGSYLFTTTKNFNKAQAQLIKAEIDSNSVKVLLTLNDALTKKKTVSKRGVINN